MTVGIRAFRDTRHCAWLWGMLTMPFVGKTSDYAINRRQRAGSETYLPTQGGVERP